MPARAHQPAPSPQQPATRTVAIVDDDGLIRDSLSALLEAYGYAVQSFASGAEFLAATLPAVACIVLDIKMPQCSGLEVLDRLCRRGAAMPPVILITGGLPQRVTGARTCLRKPIRPEELLAEIDAAFATA